MAARVLAGLVIVGSAASVLLHRRNRVREPERPVQADDPVSGVIDVKWKCECGKTYRVSGEGRHRVYWADDSTMRDPIVDRECPDCGKALPAEHVTV